MPGHVVPSSFTAVFHAETRLTTGGYALVDSFELEVDPREACPTLRITTDARIDRPPGRELWRIALAAAAVPVGSIDRDRESRRAAVESGAVSAGRLVEVELPDGWVFREEYVRVLESQPVPEIGPSGRRKRRLSVVDLALFAAQAKAIEGTDEERAKRLGMNQSVFSRRKRQARAAGVG